MPTSFASNASRSAVIGFFLLVGLTACSQHQARHLTWELQQVRFEARHPAVTQGAGSQALARMLGTARGVRLADATSEAGEVWRLHAVVQADPMRPTKLQLGLKASQSGVHPPFKAFVPLTDTTPAALEQAALRAWNLLGGMRRLAEAGPAAWSRALQATPAVAEDETFDEADWDLLAENDPVTYDAWLEQLDAADADGQHAAHAQLQVVALDRAVQQQLCSATPALLGLVAKARGLRATPYDRELALRALGGLVALGDERTVLPLIDLGQRRDSRFLLQIVYAVGALGGRQAEGYLVTLASGHADPEVRAAAEEAVNQLLEQGPRAKSPCGAGASTTPA